MSKIAGATTSHPTTSDIGLLMRQLCYNWSNQAQVYYYDIPCKCLPRHNTIQTIDRITAEHMYRTLIGAKAYQLKDNSEALEQQTDRLAKYIMQEFPDTIKGEGAIDTAIEIMTKNKIPYFQEHNNGCDCPTVCKHECNDKCKV